MNEHKRSNKAFVYFNNLPVEYVTLISLMFLFYNSFIFKLIR